MQNNQSKYTGQDFWDTLYVIINMLKLRFSHIIRNIYCTYLQVYNYTPLYLPQDSYHHNLSKNKEKISNALSKFDISLCPIFSKAITYEIIESVAAIRFAIHWIVKWKTASHLREKYLRIQKRSFESGYISRCNDIPVGITELKQLILDLGRIVKEDPNIQLFFSKTFYFHVGYGEMLKYKKHDDMKCFFPKNYEAIQESKVSKFINPVAGLVHRH